MLTGWELPMTARVGNRNYRLHTDYRDILEIFSYLDDPDLPEALRWQIALGLFYEEPVPPEDQREAAEYFLTFLSAGQMPCERGEKLLCWQQDSSLIASEVNRVAGQEIRRMPYLHWWTFLGWFHSIGPGRLSAVVGIRSKLRKGQKLEEWEKIFYRDNRQLVELKRRHSREELLQKERLQQLLN